MSHYKQKLTQNIDTNINFTVSRNKPKGNLCDLDLGKDFLDETLKPQNIKETSLINSILSKLKSTLLKKSLKERKDELQSWRKYLKMINLIKY